MPVQEDRLSVLIDGLNPNQKSAVLNTEGRLLILAGAGSGKTRVLTVRMVYLIESLGVSPSSILGLTFTNKAAAEMRQRIAAMVDGKRASEVTLCTFHSFCMKILRSEIAHLGYTSSFTLLDEQEVKRMVTLIARDILGGEGELPSLTPTLSAIEKARSKGLDAEEISGTGSEWHDNFVREVYRRLQDSMRAYNALDFDGLLWATVELFSNYPEVLERYQERYRYVMIDEYQDTNPVQYRLAALLTKKYGNLCVVGDDDQSIYGWRGAEVKNILEFGDAAVIKLEQNYRSTGNILRAANAVIGCNSQRYDKALWSDRGDGEFIEVFHAPSELEEAQAVVCRIAAMKERHALKWSDIAILYRSNALSRVMELALMKHNWNCHGRWVQGVPYNIFGGTSFYERREVKDLMAYLRVIVNPKDQEALLRVINVPRRGIGEAALDKITAYNRKNGLCLYTVLYNMTRPLFGQENAFREEVSARALRGIEAFVSTIECAKEKFSSLPLGEALMWLVDSVGYKNAIDEEVKSQQMRAFKWENVEEFVTAISEYSEEVEKRGEAATLAQFITDTPLQGDFDRKSGEKKDCEAVNLLTFHSSKGLEFPLCFLIGCEDHIIPHEKSMQESGIEEERRLFYVAITRAMRHLTISMARKRKRMGKEVASAPSRFLGEIPKELLKITRWDDL